MDLLEDQMEFTIESGEYSDQDLTIYALSTCGFCRKSMKFLRNNSIQFKYIYIDLIDFELKMELKKKLKEEFGKRVVYPYILVNKEKAMSGFIRENWEKEFLNGRKSKDDK